MTGLARAEVALEGPLDVAASLAWLAHSGDDLLERWDGRRLLRTLRTPDGRAVPYRLTALGGSATPRFEVVTADARDLDAAVAEAHISFITATVPLAELAARDPAVAALDRTFPGVRPIRQPDLLFALVRAVSAQQINLPWAATLRRRLAPLAGQRLELDGEEVYALDPARLAALEVPALRELQFSTRKAEYTIGLGVLAAAGELTAAQLAPLDDDGVVERLTAIRGLGRWTAEWILVRVLGRPVVVAGDLGVRRAVGVLYRGGAMPSEAEVRALTAHWGDAAAVAQQLALQRLLAARTE